MTTLPENILRCLPESERRKLGKSGVTATEASAKCDARLERELHGHIADHLSSHGIAFTRSRMDKKTTQKKGVADFVCCYRGLFVCFEVKLPGKKLTEDQEKFAAEIIANSGICKTVYSLKEVVEIIQQIDRMLTTSVLVSNPIKVWKIGE